MAHVVFQMLRTTNRSTYTHIAGWASRARRDVKRLSFIFFFIQQPDIQDQDPAAGVSFSGSRNNFSRRKGKKKKKSEYWAG